MKRSALSIGITLLLASVAIHADNNIAEQYQDGTGLKSSLTQTGSDNYSLQRQAGADMTPSRQVRWARGTARLRFRMGLEKGTYKSIKMGQPIRQ